MKHVVFTFFLFGVSLSSLGQSSIDFNKFSFDASSLNLILTNDTKYFNKTTSLVLLEENASADEWTYKNTLPSSLENYVLDSNLQDYSANGVFRLNFKTIGKLTLDNYYGDFNNDLSKYIQSAPDIMELCPIY